MEKYQYRIRAHHGMCLAFFKGKGYSNEFTEHMGKIKERLTENPLVCITDQTDIICSCCPKSVEFSVPRIGREEYDDKGKAVRTV
ncbi:MAG: DUF1284 domain-containing protein [Lachnospiraceae bacterium]